MESVNQETEIEIRMEENFSDIIRHSYLNVRMHYEQERVSHLK